MEVLGCVLHGYIVLLDTFVRLVSDVPPLFCQPELQFVEVILREEEGGVM